MRAFATCLTHQILRIKGYRHGRVFLHPVGQTAHDSEPNAVFIKHRHRVVARVGFLALTFFGWLHMRIRTRKITNTRGVAFVPLIIVIIIVPR